MTAEIDPLYDLPDFNIDEDLLQQTLDAFETQTPAQMAAANAKAKAERLAAKKAARMNKTSPVVVSTPLGAMISDPTAKPAAAPVSPTLGQVMNPSSPMSTAPMNTTGMPPTFLQAMDAMKSLMSRVAINYGDDNLALICKLDKANIRGEFSLMAPNLWGYMVMEATDFSPEEDDMLDSDLYDTTVKSLYDNGIVLQSMVIALEEHLDEKFEEALQDGRIMGFPPGSRFLTPKITPIAPLKAHAEEPDSAIHPEWGTW